MEAPPDLETSVPCHPVTLSHPSDWGSPLYEPEISHDNKSSGMWRCVAGGTFMEVSEEPTASVFKVKPATLHGVASQQTVMFTCYLLCLWSRNFPLFLAMSLIQWPVHFVWQKSEQVTSGPVVTQARLKTALKDTKPSLSDTEKLRYRLM